MLECVGAGVDLGRSNFLGVDGGSEGLLPVIQLARASVEAALLLLEFRRFLQEGRLSQSELFLRRGEGGSRRLHLSFVGRGLGLAGAKGLLRGLRTVASARQLGLRGLDRFRPPIQLRLPRSEERRVGKECRCRWSTEAEKK